MERLKVEVQQGDKGAAPSAPRRSPKAGRKWTNSGRKRAVSTSEAPWVEFRDGLPGAVLEESASDAFYLKGRCILRLQPTREHDALSAVPRPVPSPRLRPRRAPRRRRGVPLRHPPLLRRHRPPRPPRFASGLDAGERRRRAGLRRSRPPAPDTAFRRDRVRRAVRAGFFPHHSYGRLLPSPPTPPPCHPPPASSTTRT